MKNNLEQAKSYYNAQDNTQIASTLRLFASCLAAARNDGVEVEAVAVLLEAADRLDDEKQNNKENQSCFQKTTEESLVRNIINQIAAISGLEHPNCSMCRFRTSRGCEQNVMFPCYSFEMKGADK